MASELVQPIAQALLTCLCGATAENPNPPLNCCLRVGLEVVHDADLFTDLCCEGLNYVRLGDVYPSTQPPDFDTTRQAVSNCGIASWVVELQAGIIRCVPTGTDTSMPTCAEWTAAATQNFLDAQALRRMACCFTTAVGAIPIMDGMSVIIGRQTQSTPLGGCVERSIAVQVQIPNCDCP